MSRSDDNGPQPGDRLYQHSKRQQWGLAVLAWERDGKRAYQFEDGELRVFAEAFYKFLEEVDIPPEQGARLVAKLGRQGGVGKHEAKAGERQLTFDEQLQVFLEQFPEGFQTAEWKTGYRGEGEPRRLKRHRDAAIADARQELSLEAIDGLIAAGRHDEIARRMVEVVHGSDLVTRAQAEPIARAKPGAELSRGLRDLLYGEGDFEPRFDEFCRLVLDAGRKQLSWPLATAIPALVLPHAHVAVRPTVLAKQSEWAYPRLRFSSKPEGRVYTRILTMARAVRDALIGAGHPPRDLLDVHDFMNVTLRPAAAKLLTEVRRRTELLGEAAEHDDTAQAAPDVLEDGDDVLDEGDDVLDEDEPDDEELDEDSDDEPSAAAI